MSASTPRMPAGSSTLSERIASLQRVASSQSTLIAGTAEASRPTSTLAHPGRSFSEARASQSSPSSSPRHPNEIRAGRSSPSSSSSTPSQAVRDRIAKLQRNGGDPLIPRSSFGAPTPNPEDRSKALRPYPGAGGWGGESPLLRPQMTGGWAGGSAGGSNSVGRSLMPQDTGPITWQGQGRRQASTPASIGASHQPLSFAPTSTRDAFADLDDEEGVDAESAASPTDTSSSLSQRRPLSSHATDVTDVTGQAAALKTLTLSSTRGLPRKGSTSSTNSGSMAASLPTLPDAPSESLSTGAVGGGGSDYEADHEAVKIARGIDGEGENDLPAFPAPPSSSPRQHSPHSRAKRTFSNGHPSSSNSEYIEVGVAGLTSDKLEAVRRHAELSAFAESEGAEGELPSKADDSGPSMTTERNSKTSIKGEKLADLTVEESHPFQERDSAQTGCNLPHSDIVAPALSHAAVGNGLRSSSSHHSQVQSRGSSALSPSTSETDTTMPRTPPSSSSMSMGMTSSTSSSSFAAKQAAREVIAAGRKKSLGGLSPSTSTDGRYEETSSLVQRPTRGSSMRVSGSSRREGLLASAQAPAPAPVASSSSPLPSTSSSTQAGGGKETTTAMISPTVLLPRSPSEPFEDRPLPPLPTSTSASSFTLSPFRAAKEEDGSTRFFQPHSQSQSQPQFQPQPQAQSEAHPPAASSSSSSSPAASAPAPPSSTNRRTAGRGPSLRRPAPGKMLNLADLDASDDEYEPGWANVISSTR